MPSVANTARNSGFSTTSINVTLTVAAIGDIIAIMAYAAAGTLTVSGGGLIWTLDTPVSGAAMATATATATGSLVITVGSSGTSTSICGHAVDITGATGGIDKRGVSVATAFIATPNPISCPTLNTTIDGDLILGLFMDTNVNSGTYTGTGGYLVNIQGAFGSAIESASQGSHGSATPTATYTSSSTFTVASLAVATLPTSFPFVIDEGGWMP